MRGKPLDSGGLANLLKEYSVRSITVRMGTITVKSYRRADLVDVWRRYLPARTQVPCLKMSVKGPPPDMQASLLPCTIASEI